MTFRQFIPPIAANCINPAILRVVRYMERSSPAAGLLALPDRIDFRLDEAITDLLKKAAWYHGEHPKFEPLRQAVYLNDGPHQMAHLLVTLAATNCAKFPNVTSWLIYWAALEAQHRFSVVFCGIASHEERLTGHLVSELFAAKDRLVCEVTARMEICKTGRTDAVPKVLDNLLGGLGGDFAYADLSTKRQEQHTGADFGLIVKREFTSASDAFIPIRLQAKKSGRNGRANINAYGRPTRDDQLRRLTASGIGHYIYYQTEMARSGPIAPLVQSADYIMKVGQPLGSVDTFLESLDFASFLLQLLINEREDLMAFPSLDEAVLRIVEADEAPPGMIMAVATGGAAVQPLQVALKAACAQYRNADPDPEPPTKDDD